MYRAENEEEGCGPRIYREPREILADILEVKERIEESREKMALPRLLPELWQGAVRVSDIIPTLEGALTEAENTLFSLMRAEEELERLERELYELKCELRH